MKLAQLMLFIWFAMAAHAQDVRLRGIRAVQVGVQFLEGGGTGPCAEKSLANSLGLLEAPIKTETELRLREAGLRVGPGQALNITVSACPRIVSVTVQLTEWATIDDRARRGMVVTWQAGNILSNPTGASVREVIRDIVSKFLNDWLADNGK